MAKAADAFDDVNATDEQLIVFIDDLLQDHMKMKVMGKKSLTMHAAIETTNKEQAMYFLYIVNYQNYNIRNCSFQTFWLVM